MGKSHPST